MEGSAVSASTRCLCAGVAANAAASLRPAEGARRSGFVVGIVARENGGCGVHIRILSPDRHTSRNDASLRYARNFHPGYFGITADRQA
jgi:hypothetical protein